METFAPLFLIFGKIMSAGKAALVTSGLIGTGFLGNSLFAHIDKEAVVQTIRSELHQADEIADAMEETAVSLTEQINQEQIDGYQKEIQQLYEQLDGKDVKIALLEQERRLLIDQGDDKQCPAKCFVLER